MINIEKVVEATITKVLKPVIKGAVEEEGYTFISLTNCGFEIEEYVLQVGIMKEDKKYFGIIYIEPSGVYNAISFTAYLETDIKEYVDVDLTV